MQLQNQIIDEFRTKFPKLTLEKASLKLNINRTRLFRIYNGSEMKLTEFEAFEKAIHTNQKPHAKSFLNTAKSCIESLGEDKIQEILIEMKENLQKSYLTSQRGGL